MSQLSEEEQLRAEIMATEAYNRALDEMENAMLAAAQTQNAAAFTATVSKFALERARALARTAAESLARDLTTAELNKIGETIADALLHGKRPLDIYNRLKEVTSLDRVRQKQYENLKKKLEQSGMSPERQQRLLEKEYKRLLQDRRKTIAQTEGRYATSEARRREAEERGDEFKRWMIAADDKRVCDECIDNEADGVIPINQAFKSGHDTTPAHPRCRCSVSYGKGERVRSIFESRAKEAIEQTKKMNQEE